MKETPKKLFFLAFVFATCLFSCEGGNSGNVKAGTQPKSEISHLILKDLNGDLINADMFSGKTVFINFWATWCMPCVKEMPGIERAMQLVKNNNILFLFASNEPVDEIKKFKSDNKYPFNYLLIENQEDLNIMSLPTTFIFDRKGNLVFSEMGFRNWDEKENVEILLKASK